ncbi:mannitol-1-phosphate 5-dehydrogenase [Enterococcus sp. AZ103]|uniref:mannitol-1-phosphate 5-dehydrogenase n=1 Tax=Enterococcus sp. AZ103 TaxID=2774628 RepID=UPI003F26EE0F
MKAVHIGAGSIGRGFIGEVLHENDFEVSFLDANQNLIDQLNQDGFYQIEYLTENPIMKKIDRIKAINSISDREQAVQEITAADLITTSIGASHLDKIASLIKEGILARKKPINILANENMINASTKLKEKVFKICNETEKEEINRLGFFVDTAIDRQSFTKVITGRSIAQVEPYYEWVIDQKQMAPDTSFNLTGVTFVENMAPYIERKLFIVNASHAALAYLGAVTGYKTVQDAFQDPVISEKVRQFMTENRAYFVGKYQMNLSELLSFSEKTLVRHGNPNLSDDVNRVGKDPLRKLSPHDRLVGPVSQLVKLGLPHQTGIEVIAAGFLFQAKEDESAQLLQKNIQANGITEVVREITQLPEQTINEIVQQYQNFK